MKLYDNGFIGSENCNIVTKWSGGDYPGTFEVNIKKMPEDWLYRTKEITYSFNSNGHRSKEITDLDLNNYILVTGCSHTEGVGLALEDTYPHVLANKLNTDYYNLGLGATGQDVVVHNLVVWFSTVKVKPKAVVVQWPDFTRVITGDSASTLEPRGLWYNHEEYNRFVDLGINLNYFKAKQMMYDVLVKSIVDVPIVYCGMHKIVPFSENNVALVTVDQARDLSHAGIQSHLNFADALYRHLINN